MSRKIVTLLFVFLFAISFSSASYADWEEIKEALKEGKFSGEAGSYFEYTDTDVNNSDFGWATGYITLKYETKSFKNLKLGTRIFAHHELYNDHDNGTSDPFRTDVEKLFTLPELYLNLSFLDASSLTVGRWVHGKVSHIDDAQSEGAYLTFKEIPNLEVIVGAAVRFAEIDYDDGEDFGRNNGAQDFDTNDTYGSDSQPKLFFIEGKYKPIGLVSFNPYVMIHDGYASVYGLDTKIESKIEDIELIYGAKINYYHVSADVAGSTNSDNFSIFPYAKKGPFEFTLGYASFDDGDALNKPAWLRDYFTLVDQQKEYARSDSDKIFVKLKVTVGKFWAHVAYGDNNYDYSSTKGDRSQEHEFQFGYKITKDIDLNVRLFDIQYDNIQGIDYKKVESRIRFKF